jgi:uncharacterized protein
VRPFYFGPSAKPLFGIHHPPGRGSTRPAAAVLCNPFGAEYVRAYRALRELAHQLAAGGFHVLRFDYYGTGDSGGSAEDGTIAQWLEDTGSALDEAKEASGAERVSVIGLRFGAMLATVAGCSRSDIDTLVLWDPVVRGKDYLAELLARHAALLSRPPRPKGLRMSDPPGEALGFPLTAAMCEAIGSADLLTIQKAPAARVAVISDGTDPLTQALCDHLRHMTVAVAHEATPGPKVWLKQDDYDRTLVPQATLGVITSWLLP